MSRSTMWEPTNPAPPVIKTVAPFKQLFSSMTPLEYSPPRLRSRRLADEWSSRGRVAGKGIRDRFFRPLENHLPNNPNGHKLFASVREWDSGVPWQCPGFPDPCEVDPGWSEGSRIDATRGIGPHTLPATESADRPNTSDTARPRIDALPSRT